MYKVTIEERVGETVKKTTLETEDVKIVEKLLGVDGLVEIDSDIPNRNIDPEWQELEQKVKIKKSSLTKTKTISDEEVEEMFKRLSEECNKNPHGIRNPLTPFVPMTPYETNRGWRTPNGTGDFPYPLTVTC